MSGIELHLRDSKTIFKTTVSALVTDAVVGTLFTEPETIIELYAALRRFYHRRSSPHSAPNHSETYGGDPESNETTLVLIDLAARTIVSESIDNKRNNFCYREYNDSGGTIFSACDSLPNDWLCLQSVLDYAHLRESRIRKRYSLDARAILYGHSLLEFVANCALVDFDEMLDQDKSKRKHNSHEIVVNIHRRWLMTPREDLKGQSPREVLLAKQKLIDLDLETRMLEWRHFGHPPTPLSCDAHAYRLGGFGTHEWVLYYDLVRLLIWTACDWVLDAIHRETKSTNDRELIAELTKCKSNWLTEPNPDIGDLIPIEVIDNERRRLPEVITDEGPRLEENDWCTKIEGTNQYFFRLEGSQMEDEFVFSFHRTLEQWEAEQHDLERWHRVRKEHT